MRCAWILFAPCLLFSQTKAVVDVKGGIVINKITYANAQLTYSFDKPIILRGFSIKALNANLAKATKLSVVYEDRGSKATQVFTGKLPVVSRLKLTTSTTATAPDEKDIGVVQLK